MWLSPPFFPSQWLLLIHSSRYSGKVHCFAWINEHHDSALSALQFLISPHISMAIGHHARTSRIQSRPLDCVLPSLTIAFIWSSLSCICREWWVASSPSVFLTPTPSFLLGQSASLFWLCSVPYTLHCQLFPGYCHILDNRIFNSDHSQSLNFWMNKLHKTDICSITSTSSWLLLGLHLILLTFLIILPVTTIWNLSHHQFSWPHPALLTTASLLLSWNHQK